MPLIRIDRPDDPRIAGFRDIRERDLTGRAGLFVAEGEVVLNVLTSPASLCRPTALLLDEKRLEGLSPVLGRLPEDTPVHVAAPAVLNAIVGFHLHRGILALGEKPQARPLDACLEAMGPDAVVVAVSGVGNHDNMGGVFRNAAAFGAAAVLLDSQCCDPFYRKSIRVSVGAVLRTPMTTGLDPMAMIDRLTAASFEVLALTPGAAQSLEHVPRGGRIAIVLGPEGPGLSAEILGRCQPIGIPMSGGFDSLNVAVASGIALHHFTRPA